MKTYPSHSVFGVVLLIGTLLSATATAGDITPGEGSRQWLGPDIWPNPMQDWSVEHGTIVAIAGQNRTAHALGYRLTAESLAAPVKVRVNVSASSGITRVGFRLGIRSGIQEHRAAIFAHGVGIDAAMDADGTLWLHDQSSPSNLRPFVEPVDLVLRSEPIEPGRVRLTLSATDDRRGKVELERVVESKMLVGNLALLAESEHEGPSTVRSQAKRPRVTFREWSIRGDRLTRDDSARFGPILWSQYTVSETLLTISVQMPPLGPDDERGVALELRGPDGSWRQVAQSEYDPDARVAVLRVEDWWKTEQIPARLSYRWQGQAHYWPITIRPEPEQDASVTIAAMSCDAGYAFPQTPLVQQVLDQDPDLLFFAGDQIYEHFGGFGVARTEPVDFAILDYLRKYMQFGWTWREVLRDRPSVIIPDDHDVFHGNVWGAGGRLLHPGEKLIAGGYLMPVRFVNAVQRTQTAHLPPAVDPTPTPSGIGVYFTDMRLGPVDLAIIEDRKWKEGPASVTGSIYDRVSLGDTQLLGDRQEIFLKRWMESEAPFKVVLSQTMFARPATHTGFDLKHRPRDPDANGWPMPARDRVLRLLGPEVVMIAGDQHLGMLARLGVNEWDDGPLTLMTPGTANGHPRAWWPEHTVDGTPAASVGYTGRFMDGLGNRLSVLGVANPDRGSNTLRPNTTHPYDMARRRGSGFGLAHFIPTEDHIEFSIIRFPSLDYASRQLDVGFFEGFPYSISPRRQVRGD